MLSFSFVDKITSSNMNMTQQIIAILVMLAFIVGKMFVDRFVRKKFANTMDTINAQQSKMVTDIDDKLNKFTEVLTKVDDKLTHMEKKVLKLEENVALLFKQNDVILENQERDIMVRVIRKQIIQTADTLINQKVIVNDEFKKLLHNFKDNFVILIERIIDSNFEYYNTQLLQNAIFMMYNTSHNTIKAELMDIRDKEVYVKDMDTHLYKTLLNTFVDDFNTIKGLRNGERLSKFKAICEATMTNIINVSCRVYDISSKNL